VARDGLSRIPFEYYRATARRADLRTGAVTLRVVAAKQEACVMSHATARVARC
jgi:hypothetical protein